jgi:ClpP class serine protease
MLITLVLISIILVSGLGYLWFQARPLEVIENKIGIISVHGPIVSYEDVRIYTTMIHQAKVDKGIKGVVLAVDSPGGYAHYVEQIYLDLLELRKEKPLIASLSTALSGGYYISVAADYIYVNPTSSVGNVGVIGTGPSTLVPSEGVLESGPYKVTGNSRLLFPFNLTHALDNFATAVQENRGERLNLSYKELVRGLVYLGSESLEAGLGDEIGALQKSTQEAALRARVTNYRVVDMIQYLEVESQDNSTRMNWRSLNIYILNELHPPPSLHYLYLPQTGVREGFYSTQNGSFPKGNVTTGVSHGEVLVDTSHGNKVSAWELDILMGELAVRNRTVGFIDDWDELSQGLDGVSCLILASPTVSYSQGELERIKEFLQSGRMVILFFDPAAEYVEIPSLNGPINSVANSFGLNYGKGYLYHEEEHYGFYRNIYLKDLGGHELTNNVSSLVFFTPGRIKANHEIAGAPEGTFSSTAERMGDYTCIAEGEYNGTIFAFGDLTFLMEPFCYVEDNYRLIQNLAEIIAEVEVPEQTSTGDGDGDEDQVLAEPQLPVGTKKLFIETLNDETYTVEWEKISKNEILVERPDRSTQYYLNDEGELLRWVSNGMEAVYGEPIPDFNYPLKVGSSLEYERSYSLDMEGDSILGSVQGEEKVIGFENIRAENGETYLCAKIQVDIRDEIERSDAIIETISTGTTWLSTEAGLIKETITIETYVNDFPVARDRREMILSSIELG